ncbi:MAG: glycoside hydrolase family 15 protein [Cyanobacteria bacterium P01_D01_bin.105]
MSYQPIEDYGIIGNMRTTAMVGLNGSIDWFCHPRHDSPSIFAALLDHQKGGHFKIESTVKNDNHKQFYYPETNILITRFLCDCGVGEVIDFMPLGNSVMRNWIIRTVRTVRKTITFRAECYPAFDYARADHKAIRTATGVHFACLENPCDDVCPVQDISAPTPSPKPTDDTARVQCQYFELITQVDLEINKRGAYSEFTLQEGETVTFIFKPTGPVIALATENTPTENTPTENTSTQAQATLPNRTQSQLATPHIPLSDDQFQHLNQTATDFFDETAQYWRQWLSQCVYRGRWRRQVERSALALKLMTYEPTGAIIAAPTTSLPEQIGGERNWDYRYTWIRDAAFTVYALIRIGFTEEAAGFMTWLEARCQELGEGGSLKIMYRIDGSLDIEEESLDHLEGYRQSKPVRIGNGAFDQLQLDICGELMDSAYLYNKYGEFISYDFWTHLRYLTNWVCENWHRKDQGIWESRGGEKAHTYSRLMCWVAVDRALRIAENRSFPAERARWVTVRDEIYEDILANGWNEDRQAFVQAYDAKDLDAGCLIMPLVFFMAPSDPKMLKTIEAVRKSPDEGGLTANSLVYRYNPLNSKGDSTDGLAGEEGTFNLCTFWLVEALTRAGRADNHLLNESRRIFEEMTTYANHLGLYAEETGISGEALGNFPQAFTHIALISAAWNLSEALGEN